MPCGTPRCKCCKARSKKCRVTSTHNSRTYPTQKHTCCSTRNIIYLLECTKCIKGNQYIGQTSRPLKISLKEHRKANSLTTNLPLYKHFSQRLDHDFEKDARVTILQATTQRSLLERENNWIKVMDTIYLKGLNNQLSTTPPPPFQLLAHTPLPTIFSKCFINPLFSNLLLATLLQRSLYFSI